MQQTDVNSKHRSTAIVVFCVVLAVLLGAASVNAQDTTSKKEINFARDIQPILSENCYYCHGPAPNDRQAGLRLDVRDDALAVIESGNAKSSELFNRIVSGDPDEQMPPPNSNRKLTADQIELIKKWINNGSPWAEHWAYRPIEKSDRPAEKAIDFFIQRKLKETGLDQSPVADRATLIRRVSLDLTGLPPTREQLDAFLADQSPDAYAKMVDRYLASPAYGERMAWRWLDAARYADSNGYQGDNERTMWPWRDWVVQAYNDNMPFDQFSTWQLAGDLLPNATHEQILATGFNRNHPINGEGGRIPEENRVNYVMDMTETAGTVWLGLTFNCCRCHDHKYDRLTQKDYYSLSAFFNQTPVTGSGGDAQTKPNLAVPSDQQKQQRRTLTQAIKTAKTELNRAAEKIADGQTDWETEQQTRIDPKNRWELLKPSSAFADGATLKKLPDSSVLATVKNAKTDSYRVTGKTKLKTATGLRLEVLPHKTMRDEGLSRSGSSNFVLTNLRLLIEAPGQEPTAVKLVSADASSQQDDFSVAAALDSDSKSGWSIKSDGLKRQHEAVFIFDQPVTIPGDAQLKIVLDHQSDRARHNIGRFRIFLSDQPQPKMLGMNFDLATALIAKPADRTKAQQKIVKQAFLDADASYAAAKNLLKQQQKKLKSLNAQIPKVMVMADMPKKRKTFLLNRGSYEQRRDEVNAGVPSMLSQLPENADANRLALANWLFDESNPLTARVTVNRLWEQFFGTGLVKTTEDFGVQGEPPSHPELLDWLAAEYRDSGWDTKHMVRLILNSQTYQQSSKFTDRLRELDPDNRLLARSPRYRMPSWMLRDYALSVSGRLVQKIGGQPVNTYQPDGVWEEASFGKKKYRLGTDDELYRRSLYTFWRRIAPPTMFFDNADRMTCSVKTRRTNTPLHALNTLNDDTFVEASRLLATRTLSEFDDDDQRLKSIFKTVLLRPIREQEQQILLAAVERTREQFSQDKQAASDFIAIGETPVDEQVDPVELASWTSLCLAVLNLDESLTRQ